MSRISLWGVLKSAVLKRGRLIARVGQMLGMFAVEFRHSGLDPAPHCSERGSFTTEANPSGSLGSLWAENKSLVGDTA